MVYQSKTDYSVDNETLTNEQWDSVNTISAVAVAIDDEWATSRGLIRAQRFPWDKTRGLYHMQRSLRCALLGMSDTRFPSASSR